MALDFLAGCAGGMAGVLVGYPLDTVKVLLQTQDPNQPKYQNSIECIRRLIATDGLRALFRGVTSPLWGVTGINAIVFSIYANVQKRLSDPDTLLTHALAGATAGLFQSCICSPMELAKLRLQIGENDTPLSCLRKIYISEGVKGVARGLNLTVLRDAPAFAAYFYTYELMTRTPDGSIVSTARMLTAGGLAGVISWAVVYPVDVIKTRFQADGSTYSNSYDCLLKSVKSDGIACLFRGLTPTLVRAFPVNAVTFAVVTWTMRLLNGEVFLHTESILGKYADVVSNYGCGERSAI